MLIVLLLILAGICFLLDAVGVGIKRVALTPLGLLFLTAAVLISSWPTEPFIVD